MLMLFLCDWKNFPVIVAGCIKFLHFGKNYIYTVKVRG